MTDLSFHITDIVSNSIRAKATVVDISIREDDQYIIIKISDNGTGMDSNTIERVRNPFYTTRTTRKVGLGIPFLIQSTEQTGGYVDIQSTLGVGTIITATFVNNHIDLPPWGDLAGTIALLMTGNPDINVKFHYSKANTDFAVSTAEINEVLDGLPVNHPKVTAWIKEMIDGNIS